MSPQDQPPVVQSIPMDRIEVLNTRERNRRIFSEIVANIKAIGLKKPVVVTPRPHRDGGLRYLLVCGEGRLKAFKALGETEIPALVVQVSEEDALIMSLTENIARRQVRPLELLGTIEQLRDRQYGAREIATKTGLALKYVQGILTLLQNGEQRLLVAVEKGAIPLNAALAIVGAGDDDKAVQAALQDAYEAGTLRGNRLFDARKLVERRAKLGRSLGHNMPRKRGEVSSSTVVRAYQEQVGRQKSLVHRSSLAQQRLLLMISALQRLLNDEDFANLLRAEGLDTLPQYVAERVWPDGRRT